LTRYVSRNFLPSSLTLGTCVVGNMSRSKETGRICIHYLFFATPSYYHPLHRQLQVVITPSKLRRKALGKDTYWPFQMHGFPVGFAYPANATILGQSGARKNPIQNTISYAIIEACILGESNKDGSHSFLQFERKDWGESLRVSSLLLVTSVCRCKGVELSEE
jgi:hypothetical protein